MNFYWNIEGEDDAIGAVGDTRYMVRIKREDVGAPQRVVKLWRINLRLGRRDLRTWSVADCPMQKAQEYAELRVKDWHAKFGSVVVAE